MAERVLVERKSTELFKFEKKNDAVQGVLIAINPVVITDKDTKKPRKVTQFIIRRDDGSGVKLIGTYDICDKLTLADVGHWVSLTYTGDDPDVKGPNGQPMKRFFIEVDEQTQYVGTDADIPF